MAERVPEMPLIELLERSKGALLTPPQKYLETYRLMASLCKTPGDWLELSRDFGVGGKFSK